MVDGILINAGHWLTLTGINLHIITLVSWILTHINMCALTLSCGTHAFLAIDDCDHLPFIPAFSIGNTTHLFGLTRLTTRRQLWIESHHFLQDGYRDRS